MGGKTSKSTSQVSIPPEILARYGAVNQRAENVANTPFQQYSTDPNAFVAPLNATQNAGIANTNAASGLAQPYYSAATSALLNSQGAGMGGLDAAGGMIGSSLGTLAAANQNANPLNQQAGSFYNSAYAGAQPYNQAAAGAFGSGLAAANPFNQQAAQGFQDALSGSQPYLGAATGLAAASAGPVNADQLDIGRYLSPYLGTVLSGTKGLIDQQNATQQSGQLGDAIRSGAFGGDRSGIAAANLAQQQNLAASKTYSDILNSGFNTALGTAQQQQGVGLGAAQANRAALGSAAQQLAGIGSQQYTQGTGTAAAQQGLGQQIYGQNLGAGTAIQGLGQQVYGQGTGTGSAVQGLGQQVFGQGLSTSQQQLAAAQAQAALAQQQYGMGANTSQQLAGLGAGSQEAALQAAQAQLGAGQVQQQTQQAGQTALYNQFLQQQSYPFQVAQFLANIAMGTGSLSGSTTTTTQPGGFFSDKRLKEDIKPVGKTFDGQPIVTYKYKDEPNVVRLGLIAQDVEKKHPDAVGLAAGYKTVDYGRATEKAAERGHFASGGAPIYPGADLSAILEAQKAMYGPYGGGLYGGDAHSGAYGGSSYVPSAAVPVSGLAVAAPPTETRTPYDDMKDIIEIADAGDKMWEKSRKKKPANDDETDEPVRKRAAGGSTPYGNGLDIPDDRAQYELKTGDMPGKPRSGLSDVKDAAKTALALAKVAAMFADGGAVDDSGAASFGLGQKIRDVITKNRGLPGIDPARAIGDYFGSARDPGRWIGDALAGKPKETAPAVVASAPVAVEKPTPRRTPVVHQKTAGLKPPEPVVAAPMTAPTASPIAAPEVAATKPMLTQAPQAELPADAQYKAPGLGARVMESPVGGYLKGLGHGDTPSWVSLLSGIAAMGTAPTVHPGVALAAGLGAGTQAYMGAKKTQAELAKTAAQTATEQQRPAQIAAETGLTSAEAALERAGTLAKLNELAALNGRVVVEDPAGKFVFDGKHYSTIPKGSLAAAGTTNAAVTVNSAIGKAGHQVAQDAVAGFQTLEPAARSDAQQKISDVIEQGSRTQQTMPAAREWLGSLSQIKEGPLQPGAFNAWGRVAANNFNSTIDLLPVSPELKAQWKFDPTGLDASMVAAKMQNTVAQARAAGVDQHSLGALEKNLASTPNEAMTRNAAILLAAQEMVTAQQNIDMANYFAGVEAEAQNVSGMARSFRPDAAMSAFWSDNPSSKYDADRNRLAQMARQPQFGTWMTLLQSGDARKVDQTKRLIDGIYGAGMSRYLTGGQ